MDKRKIAVPGAGIALNYAICGYGTTLHSRSQKILDGQPHPMHKKEGK